MPSNEVSQIPHRKFCGPSCANKRGPSRPRSAARTRACPRSMNRSHLRGFLRIPGSRRAVMTHERASPTARPEPAGRPRHSSPQVSELFTEQSGGCPEGWAWRHGEDWRAGARRFTGSHGGSRWPSANLPAIRFRALTCIYCSWNDKVRPVEHLHEVTADDQEGDVAVPRGDRHASRNNPGPPAISQIAR